MWLLIAATVCLGLFASQLVTQLFRVSLLDAGAVFVASNLVLSWWVERSLE